MKDEMYDGGGDEMYFDVGVDDDVVVGVDGF